MPSRIFRTHGASPAGETGLARDEALVERLCDTVEVDGAPDVGARTWPSGDQASEARWRDVDVADRNWERRHRGIPGRDEPDGWALAWERGRAGVPWHPGP